MRRKIYDRLLHWKREMAGTTARMSEGARRVGKSYIAELDAAAENVTSDAGDGIVEGNVVEK